VSISMPLDPRAWANAANATLGPGSGSLAEVLDKLRGTHVTLKTKGGDTLDGRILIVEAMTSEADKKTGEEMRDFKVTLIDADKMNVIRLSQVAGITLHNGDLALQFQRSLDATAGEGMFQQVEVTIRLAAKSSHELVVSYVVGAPMWKPTYRVVLPEKGKGEALLQGWAVVDNTTGEDWRNVKLALTSGAPIAFRYDLHTPRDVTRADLSEIGSNRRATVSVGEAGYAAEPAPPPPAVALGDTKDGWGRRRRHRGEGAEDHVDRTGAEEARRPTRTPSCRAAAATRSRPRRRATSRARSTRSRCRRRCRRTPSRR
jgi:hypothetical protein